ncbi:unnamed protein product, partial [Rotaria magnacalcarata]
MSMFVENTFLSCISYHYFRTLYMTSNKRIDPNQPKHWHECAEYFDNESDDQDDDVNNDSEDPVMVEKDSGDESDASYVKSDGTSDEEPPRRRAKREQQLKQSEIKIFTA